MSELLVDNNKNIFNSNSITFEERERQLKQQEEIEINTKKREKNSPFSNWYQFNKEHSKEMIWLAGKYPKAHQILLFLFDQMDNYNSLVCSYKVICEALEMSESTAKRAIKVLKDNKFIEIYKSGISNVYVVNKELVWNSWGSNYKYAKFSAKIIISESEQELNVKSIKEKKVVSKSV